jgi:hypothetical protein
VSALDPDADPRAPLLYRVAARLRAYVPAFAVSVVLGVICVRAILQAAGEPAAPLDDTFIHLNYARGLAQGHFFSYVAGEGYSSGATSLLWPLLLAPFHAVGLRGVSLLWAAWLLGTIAHAGLAAEVYRLTRRLAGDAAAGGAAVMCAIFPAFAWFAWSGMETVALGWLLMRAARVAAAYCEPEAGRPRPALHELLLLAFLAPLVRPEGALASLIVAVAIALAGDARGWRRLVALAPLAGPLVVPLINLILVGHAASSTAQVKWAIGNPYYGFWGALALTGYNARLLITNIMDGGDWTVIFLPEHASVPILLGAIALPIAAARRRLPVHALFVAMVALGVLAPCTYLSFLWNRIRYVWPFAGAWFVLLGCLVREVGDLARLVRPRLVFVTPLLAGVMSGVLLTRLPWTIRDLAQSATAVQKQQVTLGRWARDHLPADARVGVNDTGAIAYLSGRRTFDVVGLTTEGESPYWVAGAGSRFEHYEKLPRERLPTHFIVYPQWMSCAPVLGRELHEETVLEQSILGGATMTVYEARWDLLGSGALPAAAPPGMRLVDEVDVADVASEKAHRYDLTDTWDQDNQATSHGVGGARVIADGGRVNRTRDRFRVEIPAGKAARLVMRVSAEAAVDLVVTAGGRPVATVPVTDASAWSEPAVALPADVGGGAVEVTVTARETEGGEKAAARFGSFHYWVYAAL